MKLYLTLLSFIIPTLIYSQDLKLPIDTIITSNHTTKIKNVSVDYLASTGTQPVWNSKGEVIASLFYTCLLYTSPSPRDRQKSRMPSSA